MAAAAAAARRIQVRALGVSTAAAQRIRTSLVESSAAAGSPSLMSRDLLRRLPHKEGLIDSGSLKDIESRILTLETVCNFYKKFQWLLVGPIVVGLLMTVPPAIDIRNRVSEIEKRQKNTTEKLSNLNKRIEYLEGRSN